MRTATLLTTALGLLTLATAASTALPLDTGSATPTGPVVRIGDYCGGTQAPTATIGRTADGMTAYCVRVRYTDAYVWSLTPDLVPVDPNVPIGPGDPCLDEGQHWVAYDGRAIVCERTKNGRMAGNLVWMYAV
ncbi:hypothetical protein IU443_12815 [Nocardia farcinica]|uniref:hypothetical protein n=1 Tax=Nocardia farcinica TaxID=37329 RepID=UPI00189444E6|nr:hypothetical protein [Nocardia farcinica]MBF6262438.1 hypothetical protein [Nocardia farcinica]MBF6280978.1 hypothetical protein [Nocardia farcinica]MBF6304565.1 hypothetical protein [Nocardia farcinica]MBF6390831.1 hypothetical protein [Nocardia farcinica]MBF6492007.1 hypothetical protein [Nocardia farcinica]